MTQEERNEIIKVIILMWEKLKSKHDLEEEFKQTLLNSSDSELITIYNQYKTKIKKNGVIDPSMWLSKQTYLKLTQIIAERENLLNLLLKITNKDIDDMVVYSNVTPLLDPEKIKALEDETAEFILSNIWYYQLLNESQNKSERREDDESVANQINAYFSSSQMSFRYIYNGVAREWAHKTPEERKIDLQRLLNPYLNVPKDKTRKRVAEPE